MATERTKVLIIGSGSGGYTAAIYAARAALDPIVICGTQVGGQLTITTDVENYPGFAEPIQGPWLMEQMAKQAENSGARLIQGEVTEVDFSSYPFKAKAGQTTYEAMSLIIATGATAKWLGLPSETEFRGFGVSSCATCDGFFFKNKKVAVIGGGNTAVEEALYLTAHCSEVLLIHRRDSLRAEAVLQKRLFAEPKIKPIWHSEALEIKGDKTPTKKVTGLVIKNNQTAKNTELKLDGVFVAIGHLPATGVFAKTPLAIKPNGYIEVTDGIYTNLEGVFAAGDVADETYRQAVTAAAMGCMSAIAAGKFLAEKA